MSSWSSEFTGIDDTCNPGCGPRFDVDKQNLFKTASVCVSDQFEWVPGQYHLHAVLLDAHRHRLLDAEVGNQFHNEHPSDRTQPAIRWGHPGIALIVVWDLLVCRWRIWDQSWEPDLEDQNWETTLRRPHYASEFGSHQRVGSITSQTCLRIEIVSSEGG